MFCYVKEKVKLISTKPIAMLDERLKPWIMISGNECKEKKKKSLVKTVR